VIRIPSCHGFCGRFYAIHDGAIDTRKQNARRQRYLTLRQALASEAILAN